MKKSITLIFLILIYVFIEQQGYSIPASTAGRINSGDTVESAFKNRQSDFQVQGEGEVIKLLRDDLSGSRHQKFILRTQSGQTLLVSHNIDLAPRVKNLKTGDKVEFYGEYEWQSKGGVIHWTHHDPSGRHVDGWLKHQGRTYQ